MTRLGLLGLIGSTVLAATTALTLGALAAPADSGSQSISSLQLLLAASPSASEPGVWNLGVRAYDRHDGRLLSEPAIDTLNGKEATFLISNARTGESLRLVLRVEQIGRKR